MKHRLWRKVLLWALTILLALIYLRIGLAKLSDTGPWVGMFSRWGYPDWMRLAVGGVEVGGALLLLVPHTAAYAAAALGGVMLGALYTHAAEGDWAQGVVPLVLLGLLAVIAAARRPRRAPSGLP